jgi:hypothetical protein
MQLKLWRAYSRITYVLCVKEGLCSALHTCLLANQSVGTRSGMLLHCAMRGHA